MAKEQSARLLRWVKPALQMMFSRITIVVVLIVCQIALIVVPLFVLHEYNIWVSLFSNLLAVALILYIISGQQNPAYKIAWCIPVLLLPVLGACVYLLFSAPITGKSTRRQMERIMKQTGRYLKQDKKAAEELKALDHTAANQAHYLEHTAGFPVYRNTETEYLSPGEDFWVRLLEDLEKAERFIFLEYFIIAEGVMWDSVLRILEEKVAQGVEVRLIYDDVGSIKTLPYRYERTLREKGIRCVVFSPFRPVISARLNNRDHRKIAVIDGRVAFTGGANLADEYVNRKEQFGYWKDACIRIEGEAVWSFTVMFLQLWQFATGQEQAFSRYRPAEPILTAGEGFVLPYGDTPVDQETVGENIYLNIIYKTKRYLYICTPYLIVGDEMVTALQLAAKDGIDVRIITPHIPDKWYVHIMTRAYYQPLLEHGVRIFEYTPGFIHSKTFVADDAVATVGTVNMDFRSLYLHYECGVWMYRTPAVEAVKRDFLDTQAQSREVTLEECRAARWPTRLLRSVIRLFAPLL